MTSRNAILARIQRHRRAAIGLGAGLVAVVITLTVMATLWNSPQQRQHPVSYTNISRNFKTCLLSTADDSTVASTVWQAIQAATTRAPINAQHLTAPTGSTTDADAYLNSLIALHCQLIVTANGNLHDALATTAARNPHIQFLNVGPPVNLTNVHNLPSPTTDQADITNYVLTSAHNTNEPPTR